MHLGSDYLLKLRVILVIDPSLINMARGLSNRSGPKLGSFQSCVLIKSKRIDLRSAYELATVDEMELMYTVSKEGMKGLEITYIGFGNGRKG
jgi:hypothetical protein